MFIKNFEQYNRDLTMLDDFLNNANSPINEMDENSIKTLVKSILKDLNINLGFVGNFGFAIAAFYPIVEGLMENMNLSSVEITPKTIVMVTLAAISVIFLEEKESRLKSKQKSELEKDTKSLLTELKLNGVGNGIVKKMVKALKSIKNLGNIVLKHSGKSVEFLTDMFAYTSLMIPILNAVNFIVDKYDLTMDMLIYNLSGIAMGVLTIIVKNGVKEILKRLGIPKDKKEEIVDDIEDEFDDIDEDPSTQYINDGGR